VPRRDTPCPDATLAQGSCLARDDVLGADLWTESGTRWTLVESLPARRTALRGPTSCRSLSSSLRAALTARAPPRKFNPKVSVFMSNCMPCWMDQPVLHRPVSDAC
jgi:hypothetical protein